MSKEELKFWELLADPEYEVKTIEIEATEPMEGRGLSPYDCIVKINGESVNRLVRLSLDVWIGEPGIVLKLEFNVPILSEDGKKIERTVKYEYDLDKGMLSKIKFTLKGKTDAVRH